MAKNKAKDRTSVELIRSAALNGTPEGFDHDPILEVVRYHVGNKSHVYKFIEWSGRFDGDFDKMADFIVKLIREHDVDGFFMTEFQQRNALERLKARFEKEFGDKFSLRQRGEFLGIGRRETMKVMTKVKPFLSVYTKIAGYAGWRNMRSAAFTYRLPDLEIAVRKYITHGPSSIQEGDDIDDDKQGLIAKRGWPRLGRKARRWENRKPRKRIVSVKGDSNGDHKNKVWLERFEDWLQMTSIWRIDPTHEGTHHQRLIDGSWYTNLH